MNNNKSLLLKISVIMNTVLAFFGSYIGNLYIIQIIALIPAFLAVPLKEIKIKKLAPKQDRGGEDNARIKSQI